MSNLDYNLREQIYENGDKTIRIFKTRKFGTIKYLAVKVYTKKFHKDKYSSEYELIHKIKSPGVVNIYSYSEDQNHYYMEMEYCATGDLSKCLWQNKNNLYGERMIKLISTQLLSGLQALHKNGIIHCNLKPSNILIDEYGNVKICDFLKSLKVDTLTNALIKKNKTSMTPCYTAPELFQEDGKYSFKSDLWALGCIMYELAVGQVPFFDDSIGKLINKIMHTDVDFSRRELVNYSDEFLEVLKKLLIRNPNERGTWGEIERMSWWDGYFYNDSQNIKTESGNIRNKIDTKTTENQGTDTLSLSMIAFNNKNMNEYGNEKKNDIDNADQEFDFQPDDLDEVDEHNSKRTTSTNLNDNINNNNQMTKSQFPLGVSVINISKIYKRDKRNYNEINSELNISSCEQMPKIENFIFHQSDRVIKPIIGNKLIEEVQVTSYFKSKLPFTPKRKENLKEMMANQKELKNVENYLYNIYNTLEQCAAKKDYDNLLNLLKYFETLVFDREIANNLINTSFVQQFIQFLNVIDNDNIKTRCCCIIGYLVRYATIIEAPLDNYGFCDIICNVIKKADNDGDLIRKACATLGEYLFYVGTQEETPENHEWSINTKYINILLYCLEQKRNEIVKFYTIKTIENLCILTNVSKEYFAKNTNFLDKILYVFMNSHNTELKFSAISTISQLIRHDKDLIQLFIKKCPLLTDKSIFLKEPDNIRQCLINCLLFSIEGKATNLQYLIPNCENLLETLLKLWEQFNVVLKVKAILLIGFFMTNPIITLKYGEQIFPQMQKFCAEKNKEVHTSVKFFEQFVGGNCPDYIKKLNSLLKTSPDKANEIVKYSKTFETMGIYHRISYRLFTSEILNSIVDFILNHKNESLNGQLLDVLIKFSENPLAVEQNIDTILSDLLQKILKLSEIIKAENISKITLICANILSIILTDDKLYIPNSNEGIRTKEVKNLIKTLVPILKKLLANKDITEETLSLLCLIIERDDTFIDLYKKEGVLTIIFKIMEQKELSNNLNIVKILTSFVESPDMDFNEIVSLNLIDKVNFLLDRGFKEREESNEDECESSYIDYIFEVYYDIMVKLSEYKSKKFPGKVDMDKYNKEFVSKIEGCAKNFNKCIQLIGDQRNNIIQEMACICLTIILKLFVGKKIEGVDFIFTDKDIPNLLKGLELNCRKVHKKMFRIFIWIIQFQENGKKILKPFVNFIIPLLENIINTSADPDLIAAAQNFMNIEIKKIK